jgi:hypothetical protein
MTHTAGEEHQVSKLNVTLNGVTKTVELACDKAQHDLVFAGKKGSNDLSVTLIPSAAGLTQTTLTSFGLRPN